MTTATPQPASVAPTTEPVILPKRTVQAVQAYVPPLEGRRSKIRLDFNENTMGFSHIMPDDVDVTLVNTYPEYQAFVGELAQYFEVSTDQLLVTNGSDEALAVLANTFIEPGEDVALMSKPTFALIGHYLALAGADVVALPVNDRLAHDTVAIEAKLKELTDAGRPPKLAIFASPDNPTGALLPLETLLTWCKAYPQTLFVLDEAYAEYCGQTVLPHLRERLARGQENLMMTRTFSKAWALAGCRLGVVVGAPRLISAMTCVRSPYSVNTMAVNLASKLLPDSATVVADAQAAMARKKALISELTDLGYGVHDGHANFFLLNVGLEAKPLTAFAAQHGVLLRDRSMVPSLEGMVRVSVGSEGENATFLQLLENFHQQRTLLFDLDGTLVDTSQSYDATVDWLVSHFAPEHPLQPGELDALRQGGGFNDDWDATAHLLKTRGKTVAWEEIARLGTEHYLSIAKDAETLMVEPEWLASLAKRYRLGIVTGRYRNEYEGVWAEQLNPYFETVICRDDVTLENGELAPGKPAPDGLVEALKRLGCSSGYYIGNSVDDMKASIAAKLTPIGVATTQAANELDVAGSETTLDHPNQLYQVFSPRQQ